MPRNDLHAGSVDSTEWQARRLDRVRQRRGRLGRRAVDQRLRPAHRPGHYQAEDDRGDRLVQPLQHFFAHVDGVKEAAGEMDLGTAQHLG